MIELPILYAQTSGGGLTQWQTYTSGPYVVTVHGKVGGKQTTSKKASRATNVGRANQRTAEEQAVFDAKSAWDKKRDEGYFETQDQALTATVYLPMLAQPLMKDVRRKGEKFKVQREVVFPCDVQRKHNGLRALARLHPGGRVEFISRENEHWTTLGHISAALWDIGKAGDIFDGEIYCHGVKLQTLNSWVKVYQPETLLLDYCIYDLPISAGAGGGAWEDRRAELERRFSAVAACTSPLARFPLQLVKTARVDCMAQVTELGKQAIAEGYEGLILRQLDKPYRFNHRVDSLLKWKEFKDAEFQVLKILEREHYDAALDTVYQIADKYVLQNNVNERTFECVCHGTIAERRAYLLRPDEHIGKFLTVRFLERSIDGIPQGNPVSKGFRLEGDLPRVQDESVWG